MGADRGGGRQRLPMGGVHRLVGANGRQLGGGGFLLRHALVRVRQAKGTTLSK